MVTKVQDVQAIPADIHGLARPAHRTAGVQWLNRKIAKRALFAFGDVVALVLSHLVAATMVQHWLRVPREFLSPRDYWFFYLPFLLAVLYLLDRNHSPDLRRPEKELELAVKGVSFAFLLLECANFVIFKTAPFSRYLMVTWYLIGLPLVLVSRFGLRHFYGALWRRGLARRKTLLVGSADRLSAFHSLLAIQRYQAYDIVGVLPVDGPSRAQGIVPSVPVLGTLPQWREVARENGVEQIVVCLPRTSEESHSIV